GVGRLSQEVSRRPRYGRDVLEPVHRRSRPYDVHAAVIRPIPARVQRGVLPEPAGRRIAPEGPHHHRGEGAHPALQGGAAPGSGGRAVDLRGPRQAGHRLPQARAGVQAPPELRPGADAGVAAVGGAGLQGYVVRRVLLALPVLVWVSLLVFVVLRLERGDLADIMMRAQATPRGVLRL